MMVDIATSTWMFGSLMLTYVYDEPLTPNGVAIRVSKINTLLQHRSSSERVDI